MANLDLRTFTYPLAANAYLRIGFAGNTVRCIQSSASFKIAADIESNTADMEQGIGYNYDTPFSTIYITNGPTAQDITLTMGFGRIDDNRQSGQINALLPGASTLLSTADVSLDQGNNSAIAARAGRTRLIIEADINNTVDLRAGNPVADTTGSVLTPGAIREFITTDDMTVRNPTASGANGQVFRVTEEYN